MVYSRTVGGPYREWLYAIPLLHQLKYPDGISHDNVPFDPNKPDWGNDGLDHLKLEEFKKFIQNEKYVNVCMYVLCTYVCIQMLYHEPFLGDRPKSLQKC